MSFFFTKTGMLRPRGAAVVALLTAAGFVAICVAAILLAGCQVGPFVPPGAPVCSSDADCKEGTHCAFQAPGWRARCMDGPNDIDTIPDEMRRRDGGP